MGVTAFDVPYSSIGLEISPNVHERSVLAGAKAVFQILGALIASLVPVVIGVQMGVSLGTLALIFVAAMPVAMAAFLMWTPKYTPKVVHTHPSLWGAWRNCLRQNAFRRLMIAFFAVQAANAMTVGLLVLFVTHVLEEPQPVSNATATKLVRNSFMMLI